MKTAILTATIFLGCFLPLNYTPHTNAQSGCPGGPGPVPNNIGSASIIVTLAKFSGIAPPSAPESANAGVKPEAIDIRVKDEGDVRYDGRDVYNSAPSGSCQVASTHYLPNAPLIAGPSSGATAAGLRFVLLAEEPGDGSSVLTELALRFYENVGGVPSVAPFYITTLAGNNCALTSGYYVFSLSAAQVSALDPEIQLANQSSASCPTNIYVGASLIVDRASAPSSTTGEILYVGKTSSSCTFSITPATTQTFDASGGTGTVNVDYPGASSKGCLWTSGSSDPWVTITAGTNGSTGVTVKYSVDPNATGNMRQATLTIAGQPLTIQQSCVSITPPRSKEFNSSTASGTILYATQGAGCTLTTTPSNPWITNISASNGMVNYMVTANSAAGAPSRTGFIDLSGFIYAIKQAGPGGDCTTASISPGDSKVGAVSSGDCFSAVNNTLIADRYSFSGNAGSHVSFSITGTSNARLNLIDPNNRLIANAIPPPLSIDLPFDGAYTVEVMQVSAASFFSYTLSMCRFDFTPSALYATHIGGAGNIDVATQGGCSWNASSNGWLTVTSGSSYTGSQPVAYTVDSSSETERRVNAVIVAGKEFLITQLGVPFYYSDFDRDRKTDIALFRPSNITWYVLNSQSGTVTTQQWGFGSDTIVPGDYDGDGKTDFAVWRPSEGNWYIINSSVGTVTKQQWGINGDVPVPGDYDGDGKTDFAVWRPSNGVWYIINSSTGSVRTVVWGTNGDRPVPSDYDGDGRVDTAIFRPSTGVWFIIKSSNGSVSIYGWGVSTDKCVPADYDGDGLTDVAVWRPSNGVWFMINSSTGSATTVSWGVTTDRPMVGDFDGDARADTVIYRPNGGGNSFWYILNSSNGTVRVVQFGDLNDLPVPAAFVR